MLTRTVQGSKGNTYIVAERDGKWTCSCPHHRFRNVTCKHIRKVKQDVGDVAQEDDPESFDPAAFFDDPFEGL